MEKLVNKIEKAIRDKYSTGAGQTSRLIENEVARCQSEVNEYFFKVQGIIKVMYCADLDSRTCSDCSMHNGVIFYVNEDRPLCQDTVTVDVNIYLFNMY